MRSVALDLLNVDVPSTRLANIENYELMLQRIGLGQFVPIGTDLAFTPLLANMSRAAQVARDFRRRNLFIYFNIAPLGFDVRDSVHNGTTTSILDTVVGHIPEAAEQRAILNTALAYGSRGIHYQVLDAQTNQLGPAFTAGTRAGLREGVNPDFGSNGPLTVDTAQNRFASLRFRGSATSGWYGIHDTAGYDLRNVYVGWSNRSGETRWYNRWLRDSIGPLLMKLHWRDAYSIHYTVPQPYRLKQYTYRGAYDSVTYRSVGHRPLPSGEIVTDVRSYRRDWIGSGANRRDTLVADSLTRTYVELGLFYTKSSSADRSRDTNWLVVVNRRAMERPAEVAPTTDRGRLLDTLAEMRVIRLKLNLLNFEQFNFVRVREMGTDTVRLPLAGGPRAPLDTVVHADSAVRIALRPGGAALLRVTYLEPDTNISAGLIAYNNQRKIVWDPVQRRYHCVYRSGNEGQRIDSVCYRRSAPMSDASGSIVWESDTIIWETGRRGYTLSRMNDPQDSIVFNRHPSITIRRVAVGGLAGTAAIIVWTAHRVPVSFTAHQILLRTIWSPDGTAPAIMDHTVEVVDSAIKGHPGSAWGTPVVARADGAEIIAWSDSAVGIKAVARVLNDPNAGEWWRSPATYTDTIHVSAAQKCCFGRSGWFPSVPTFTHIVSRDSNVAVVWEQIKSGTYADPTASDIYFKRLQHTNGAGGDTLVALDSSLAVINPAGGVHRHPSITQHQDAWREVQDMITWESPAEYIKPAMKIYVRSVFTETRTFNATDQPDIMTSKPELWGIAYHATPWVHGDWYHPNICSITFRDSSDVRKSLGSVAHNRSYVLGGDTVRNIMGEYSVQWAAERSRGWRPYNYGGRWLSNSETPDSQRTSHAVLYEVPGDSGRRRLRTTREYFLGKVRPSGYLADGRELSMRFDDSTGSGVVFHIADAWYATDSTSVPVPMCARDTGLRHVNDLSTATGLLRTSAFDAGDSTAVGVWLAASFVGDTTGYWPSRVTFVVELVDSVTGARIDRLDSFRISTTYRNRERTVVRNLDLLSSRYLIRVTVDTSGIDIPPFTLESRFPVTETSMFISDTTGAWKTHRAPPELRRSLRVTAGPNPTSRSAQVRFSVPDEGRVRVVLTRSDGTGAETLHDGWLTRGRFGLDMDVGDLRPGVYLVRVATNDAEGVAKIVVTHD